MPLTKFFLLTLAAAAAAFAAAALVHNDYLFFAGYVVLQFVVLATAWNILGGYCGYVNFGTAAFFAIGAYTAVALHKLADPQRVPWIDENCRSGALGCVECKRDLAESLNVYMRPVRERRAALDASEAESILAEGDERARAVAADTLRDVKDAMHL